METATTVIVYYPAPEGAVNACAVSKAKKQLLI